ncbi:hypothetical protein HPP92_015914 [Vanilla planifolia]|uniref:Uncharacterized protein n=1 Tax=Vanilla planifolia TaxID=51239 RepID=A0A835URK9_VANPL|nr:hypothetical protein HPP92_015914 [Vanilla planifolia]
MFSGPKRPHDRVPLKLMKADWHSCLDSRVGFKGFAVPKEFQDKAVKFDFHGQPAELKHGSVVIAAITSCNKHQIKCNAWCWPCSKEGFGLQQYLNQQGFNIVGYGCTTCVWKLWGPLRRQLLQRFQKMVDIDFDKEPIGTGKDEEVYISKDIWPSTEEIAEVNSASM